MAYVKQTWVDRETPLDAEHMNHIEEGIAANDAALEEMKKQPASSVAVDNTLSVEGNAADAKATGDAVRQLTEEMANVKTNGDMQKITYDDLMESDTKSGGFLLTNGNFQAGANWYTSDFLELPKGLSAAYVLPAHATVGALCFYDEEKKCVQAVTSPTTGGVAEGYVTPIETAKYYRFTVYSKDDNAHGVRTNQKIEFRNLALISDFSTKTQRSPLAGKKWSVYGDSRSQEGYITADKYFDLLSDKCGGISITNHAVSGARMYEQLSVALSSTETADIVSVYIGVNDWGRSEPVPLGQLSDETSESTFYANTKKMIETLCSKHPKAHLFFITPVGQVGFESFAASGINDNALGYTIYDYVNAIKQCCAMYGVPVCNDAEEGGYSPLIAEQNALYFADGLHQNAAGQEKLADNIYRFMTRYMY